MSPTPSSPFRLMTLASVVASTLAAPAIAQVTVPPGLGGRFTETPVSSAPDLLQLAQLGAALNSGKEPDKRVQFYSDGRPAEMCTLRGAPSEVIEATFVPHPDGAQSGPIKSYRGNAGIDCDAKGVGLITFADGATWMGEVSSVKKPIPRSILPVPKGFGVHRAANGTITVGQAAPNDTDTWGWAFTQVMSTVSTAAVTTVGAAAEAPATTTLSVSAGNEARMVLGGEAATSRTLSTAAAREARMARGGEAAGAADAPSFASTFAPTGGAAPAVGDPFRPWPEVAGEDPLVTLRAQLSPSTFRPMHIIQYTAGFDPVARGDLKDYVRKCGGDVPSVWTFERSVRKQTPFEVTFSDPKVADVRRYIGGGYACTFLHEGSASKSYVTSETQPVFGLITYADGSYWLGSVSGMPMHFPARRVLGISSEAVDWMNSAVPAPYGQGEWGLRDGTRLQGSARMQPGSVARPLMTSLERAQLPDGAVVTRAATAAQDANSYVAARIADASLRMVDGKIVASSARIVWPSGVQFVGSLEEGRPVKGTVTYPNGLRISGSLVARDDGSMAWNFSGDTINVRTPFETPMGPAGRYSVQTTDALRDASLVVDGSPPPESFLRGFPMDAATLAKPTSNTRDCPQPTTVPAGWVVWWPTCQGGPNASVTVYSRDARYQLFHSWRGGGIPKLALIASAGNLVPGLVSGYDLYEETWDSSDYKADVDVGYWDINTIEADAFTTDAVPTPIGEARLPAGDGGPPVFEGVFVGLTPVRGYCRVPESEGGGLEPCEFRSGNRVDTGHQMRRQRIASMQQDARQRNNRFRKQQQQERDAEEAAAQQAAADEAQRKLEEEEEEAEAAAASQASWAAWMNQKQAENAAFAAQMNKNAQQYNAAVNAADAKARWDAGVAAHNQSQRDAAQAIADGAGFRPAAPTYEDDDEEVTSSGSVNAGPRSGSSSSGGQTYGAVKDECGQLGRDVISAKYRLEKRCLRQKRDDETIAAWRDFQNTCMEDGKSEVEDLQVKYDACLSKNPSGGGVIRY
jgi:hypothetical protein